MLSITDTKYKYLRWLLFASLHICVLTYQMDKYITLKTNLEAGQNVTLKYRIFSIKSLAM